MKDLNNLFRKANFCSYSSMVNANVDLVLEEELVISVNQTSGEIRMLNAKVKLLLAQNFIKL